MRSWGHRPSNTLLVGGLIVAINAESKSIIPINITDAFDIAITLLVVYSLHMLMYANEIQKRLFIVCSTKIRSHPSAISRELFNKWGASTGRNAMKEKRKALCL